MAADPALYQDALLAAVANDVPHDEEVARQIELLDELQFALDLALRALPQLALPRAQIAVACAFHGARPQKRVHGFALRHGIARKLVAKIVQREFQTRRQLQGVRDGFGQIGEKLQHLLRRFDIALAVTRQQASRGIERAMVANAGEDIENLALFRLGVLCALRGQQWQAQAARQLDGRPDCGPLARGCSGAAVRHKRSRGRRSR